MFYFKPPAMTAQINPQTPSIQGPLLKRSARVGETEMGTEKGSKHKYQRDITDIPGRHQQFIHTGDFGIKWQIEFF